MKKEFERLARSEQVKMVRNLREQGYSTRLIARCLDLPESEVRYMVRRE